ncbi:MAG: TetR family transcriptional regulator [Microbacterium sp.]
MPRISVDKRREALAEAALRVLAREGLAATTTRAIAAEAGMSLASVHYAYASRDELLAEVVRRVVASESAAVAASLAELVELMPTAPRGREGLRALLAEALGAYLSSLGADGAGLERGMLELSLASLREREGASVAPEQYRQYRELVAEVLQSAADATGMRWTVPPEEIARTIVALSDGLTIAYAIDGGPDGNALKAILPGVLALAVEAEGGAR